MGEGDLRRLTRSSYKRHLCSSVGISKDEAYDDFYNYEAEEDQKDEPMSSIEWFDLRSRRKRQILEEPKKESSLIYTVCVG